MALNLTTFNFYHSSNSKELIIITHGAREGIDSSFLTKIILRIKTEKNSLLAIQMPFKNRGQSQSSGKELKEELAALQAALEFVNYKDYDRLHFIGKSLGGVIFSRYLKGQPLDVQSKSELTVLGYICGDATIPDSIAKINIIQGENDEYGTSQQLQNELDKSPVKSKVLNLVKGGDHSYRNANKEPEFQDKAIELI